MREAEEGAAAGAPFYMELSTFTAAPIELVGGPGGGATAGAPPFTELSAFTTVPIELVGGPGGGAAAGAPPRN